MGHALVYFAAIVIHELFHIFAAKVLFGEKISIALLPSGFSGKWNKFQPEKWIQCVVYASGPVGNILTAMAAKIFPFDFCFKNEFVNACIIIGIFNLLPLYPLDGGNILLILLYNRVGTLRTYSIMKKLGCTLRTLFLAAGIYTMLSNNNPSLLLTVIFLPGLENIRRSVKRLNLSLLIRRKERILRKKFYQMRDILVLKDLSLGETMLLMDYDKYHIIHVADENLKILCEITEQQLIDAILEHNVGKTLEEVFLK